MEPAKSAAADDAPAPAPESARLREVGLLFLKLGLIGFGGPAAHIAMMEDEVVRRRRWLDRDKFLDLLGATYLIPGPNSTELAIHLGHARAGFPGLLVAGSCFILPATLIVMGCAWAYLHYGASPEAGHLLYGVKPVIIAVVGQALWGLGRTAIKTHGLAVLALATMLLGAWGWHELILLFAAGFIMVVLRALRQHKNRGAPLALSATPVPVMKTAASIAPAATAATGLTAAAVPFGLWPMFWFFMKVGSVLYGSGYVLLVFLRADLVQRWHWLTEAQLLDAIAVGQVTPGPVFTTATFVGYLLHGTSGALVATAGIFLPAFFFVALSGPLIPRLRASPLAAAFLNGVNAASLGLMALVTWPLARAAIQDGVTLGLGAISLLLLLRYRVSSAWLVLGGAAVGLASSFWR